jgi:hypothetical protein
MQRQQRMQLNAGQRQQQWRSHERGAVRTTPSVARRPLQHQRRRTVAAFAAAAAPVARAPILQALQNGCVLLFCF